MPDSMSAAMRLARLLLFGAMLACAVCNESVCAQTAQQVAPTRVPMPDNAKLTLLIQMHIAALSQANLTGNYSVLHALGSPAFQAVNSTAQLAANFTVFRSQGIDISPTITKAVAKSAVSGTEWPRAHSETSTAMAPTATPRLTDTC